MKHLAAIDIGTNSVLLTIAQCEDGGGVTPLWEEAHITRIGEGLSTRNEFGEPAMERTLAVLTQYAQRCRTHRVSEIRAVGTAAFRKATNSHVFIQRVVQCCGFDIRSISGEEEAALAFHAAAHDFGNDLLVLDIGGGSTEFIWPEGETMQAHSFPLGSVVLQEEYGHTDPIAPAEYEAMRACIVSALDVVRDKLRQRPSQLVALAGTATTLVAMHRGLERYAHDQVHGTVMTQAEIALLVERLRTATIAARKQMPGLEPERADVILSGALLLLETMMALHYAEVTISDRGVRWGLLYEACAHQ